MKTLKMRMATLVLAIGITGTAQAATVVTGTNVTLSGPTNNTWIWPNDNLTNDYSLGVDWGQYGYGGWDVGYFDKVNKYGSYQFSGADRYGNYSTLRGQTMTVAEGINIYLASYGDEFSNSTLMNAQFPVLLSGSGANGSIDIPFGTFYLAITKGAWDGSNGDVYGWALLSSSSSGLAMLSNAVAYGTSGIFVGTTNIVPVPEPETYAMMLAGLGLVGAVARRRKLAKV